MLLVFTSHLRICSVILRCKSDERDADDEDDDERNCSKRRAIQRRSMPF